MTPARAVPVKNIKNAVADRRNRSPLGNNFTPLEYFAV